MKTNISRLICILLCVSWGACSQTTAPRDDEKAEPRHAAEANLEDASSVLGSALPGTLLLTSETDFASEIIAGVDRFLLRQIEQSIKQRQRHWARDDSSERAYNESVSPNRTRFARIIGAHEERLAFDGLELIATTKQGATVGEGRGFKAYAVRWPVIRDVHGEGLLLQPTGRVPIGHVVAVPDPDQTPEMLVGLADGVAMESQFARRLAENGFQVIIPTLIDRANVDAPPPWKRDDLYGSAREFARQVVDGVQDRDRTALSNREYLYRPAFELGRHLIGYETQKVLAIIDWFAKQAADDARIGVFGYGGGGLLALYAGAIDPRIDVTLVSGYYGPRENLWQEPIDRNVFGLLDEFGDAELATLIAPRTLIIEASKAPEFVIPAGTRGAPGRVVTPSFQDVEAEVDRAGSLLGKLHPDARPYLIGHSNGHGAFGSKPALETFVATLAHNKRLMEAGPEPEDLRKTFDPHARLRSQLGEIEDDTQELLNESRKVREEFWKAADRSSVEQWKETTDSYRQYFYDEIIGRIDQPLLPPRVRTRQIYDEPELRGYEVVMDIYPDVIAYGILLLPKDLQPGERRPVVVCQHGLEDRPSDLAQPGHHDPLYNMFAVRLAERGFITFAPQNLYIFGDRFRTLQRKAQPLKKTLFSIIVPQHQQATDWLASLPFVDPDRIAFYGLSYGGKTAMRVPPLVDNYSLVISSGDFNDWIWTTASTRNRYTYVTRRQYEMFEFDLGNTFNYAEMAGLIAPRPFMVERGHRDGVARDETVAFEFAKVRLLYADLEISDRARIEYFDGPHTIHGVGTFEFLHQHLEWPDPSSASDRR